MGVEKQLHPCKVENSGFVSGVLISGKLPTHEQELASPLKLRPFLPGTKALQSKPANSSRLAFSLAESVLPDPKASLTHFSG